jgi:hypothetical protein
MSSAPQKVTSRYVRNLLVKGKNNDFELMTILNQYAIVDELQVGRYYEARVVRLHVGHVAMGVTPEQAIQRCLAKHGVTFR